MLGATSIAIIDGHYGAGSLIAVITVAMLVMTRYVFRDVRAKWEWWITIGADALDLDLPGGRSLIHRLDPVHRRVRYNQIYAVETRLEAYRSVGMANMHRSYAIRLKTGEIILLTYSILVWPKARAAFFPCCSLPPPRWDAASLGADKQTTLWRRVAWTGGLAMISVIVGLLAAVIIKSAFF